MNLRALIHELIHRLKVFIPWLPIESKFRFAEVDPKKLYRSAQPSNKFINYLIKKYGIKSIIVLRGRADQSRVNYAQSRGLKVIHIPLGSGKPPNESDIVKFLSEVNESENQPAVIHCLQGRDRTGCMCLIYRIEVMSWHFDNAWKEMIKFGFQSLPWHNKTQGEIKKWLSNRYDNQLTLSVE